VLLYEIPGKFYMNEGHGTRQADSGTVPAKWERLAVLASGNVTGRMRGNVAVLGSWLRLSRQLYHNDILIESRDKQTPTATTVIVVTVGAAPDID